MAHDRSEINGQEYFFRPLEDTVYAIYFASLIFRESGL